MSGERGWRDSPEMRGGYMAGVRAGMREALVSGDEAASRPAPSADPPAQPAEPAPTPRESREGWRFVSSNEIAERFRVTWESGVRDWRPFADYTIGLMALARRDAFREAAEMVLERIEHWVGEAREHAKNGEDAAEAWVAVATLESIAAALEAKAKEEP